MLCMYILPGYKESVRLLVKVAISSVCGRWLREVQGDTAP